MKYRRKDSDIEAIQFQLDNVNTITSFVKAKHDICYIEGKPYIVFIETKRFGKRNAHIGDWIIFNGRDYDVIKSARFDEIYAPITDGCPQCDPDNIYLRYNGCVPNFCKYCGKDLSEYQIT